MKRLVDHSLLSWKHDPYRKSLLLRGARQVGKTYAIRQLGKTFDRFVEVNLEANPRLQSLFEHNLDPKRILSELSLLLNIAPISAGSTLLFFDEIQACPRAITALRYFYEEMPELHIIGAGSLLDFGIQQVGIPVGRVQFLYLYPVSFAEFLCATESSQALKAILEQNINQEIGVAIHEHLLRLLAHYLAIGGMPHVVQLWIQTKDAQRCAIEHNTLIDSYRQDFYKYAKQKQIPHLTALFNNIPLQLGKKFKYSAVEGGFRSRELSPGLDLLCMANVAQKVRFSAGHGIPLGAEVKYDDFKVLLLDIGLSQALLGMQLSDWILEPSRTFVNKGMLVEAFVGQELLAYSSSRATNDLYYWHRHGEGGTAELDYLVPTSKGVVPIEVKSGKGNTLRSMRLFLENHPKTPYGLRFSAHNYSEHENIKSYPLYAVAKIFMEEQATAFNFLVNESLR